MSEIKVNKLSPRSGTAVTLGDSGDTFTIPSGATLAIAGSVTGFTSAGIDDNATSVAITINSSEQVGIGTTSFDQDAKLTIAGSGSGGSNPSSINANTVATFRRTGGTSHVANISVLSGTTGASILNLGDRDDEDIGSITYNHSDNSMAFTTNTSEKMRTTSAGDLLVGTTSTNPGIGNTNTGFSITNGGGQVGNIAISQNGNYSANFNRNTSDGTVVQISKDGTVKHVITTTGLGIGTSAPSRTLSVFDTTPIIALQNSTTGQASNDGFQLQLSSDDGYVWNYESSGHTLFGTANTERMRINSSGNVGIGETAPLGLLHVKTADTGASAVSGNANEFVIENTGNVGMTIQSANDGTGNLYFGDVANGSVGRVSYDHSNNSMSFNTNAAERMRIKSTGKIGIGTSSPDAVLQVGALGQSGSDRGAVAIKTVANYTTFGQAGIYIEEASGSEGYYMGVDVSGGMFFNNSGAAGTTLYLADDDNVGINTAAPNSIGSNITTLEITGGSTIRTGGVRINNSDNTIAASFYGSNTGATFGTESNADLKFVTNNNERVRIHSDGVMSAVNGIALGVGTANTASNVLNDYEEGTWSPALTTDGGGGNSGVTFGARYGSYTKIGNQVTVHVYVDLDAVVAFGTGNAIISTLPFTSTSSNSQYRSGVSIGYTLNWDEAPVAGTITTNSTYIYLRKHSSTDAQSNYNDIVVVGDMNANSAIILTATYETDA